MTLKSKLTTAILLLLSGVFAVSEARLNLVQVAVAPSLNLGSMPIGDANHNGLMELMGTNRQQDSLLVLEFEGNSWRELKQRNSRPLPAAIGDGDRDGKADLVSAQRIYEALRPDTIPSESVWGFSSEGGFPYAQFTDLDKDSLPEVVFGSNGGAGIRIFENRGDNHYVQVCSTHTGPSGTFAVGDFDRDSLFELACGSMEGPLRLFECTGPDQYALICSTTIAHDITTYRFAAASDMDLNGLREFIYTAKLDSDPSLRVIRVFEEPVHGELEMVWSMLFSAGVMVSCDVAAGDADGDGIDEIGFSTGSRIKLLRCSGLHQYEVAWESPTEADWLRFYDINGDHRNELITYSLWDSTRVFEDTEGLVSLQFERLPKSQVVNLPATIVRVGASIVFPGLAKGTSVSLYDIRGRVVAKHTVVNASEWRWNLTDQAGRPVPSGTYFATIRSQGRMTRSKLCVIN